MELAVFFTKRPGERAFILEFNREDAVIKKYFGKNIFSSIIVI